MNRSSMSAVGFRSSLRASRIPLLLILVAIVFQNAAAQSQPLVNTSSSLKLGWIGTLKTGNANTLLIGHPGLFAFNMAVDEANAADEWMKQTPITKIISDSKADPSTTITSTYSMIQQGVNAVVGEYLSGLSTVQQYVQQYYKVPHMSPGSTALEFTTQHATTFPYFMRNVPMVGYEAIQMVTLCLQQGWSRVGVIYTSDAFGAGGATQFAKAAAAGGVEVAVSTSFNIGDTDVSFQVKRLVDADARIIIYWGLSGDLRTVWYSATNPAITGGVNLLGDGYQWILNHGVTTPQNVLDSTNNPDPNMLAWSRGQIGLAYYIDKTTTTWKTFEAAYRARPFSNQTSTINPADTSTPIGVYAAFTYDATWQMIRAMRRMVYELGLDPAAPANRQIFYQVATNVTFTGVTGLMKLSSIGDRITPCALVNFKRASQTWEQIGFISDTDIQLVGGSTLEYAGNDPTFRPLDRTPRGRAMTSNATKIGLIVTCAVLMFIFLLVQISIFVQRNESAMKAASPTFLGIYVLGVQMLCASVFPRALESEASIGASWPCSADLWLTNLGYTLLIGALLLKTFRLQVIFNRRKLRATSSLSDERLLMILGVMVLLETALLLGLNLGAKTQVTLREYSTNTDYRVCYSENPNSSNALTNVYIPGVISTRFALLILTVICVFRVRNLPDSFNESKQLGLTIYNLLFMSVLLPAIDVAMGRSSNDSVAAYSVCVFAICFLSVSIMFVPKWVAVAQGKIGSATSAGNTIAGENGGSNLNLSKNLSPSMRGSHLIAGGPQKLQASGDHKTTRRSSEMTRSSPAPFPVARGRTNTPATTVHGSANASANGSTNASELHTLPTIPSASVAEQSVDESDVIVKLGQYGGGVSPLAVPNSPNRTGASSPSGTRLRLHVPETMADQLSRYLAYEGQYNEKLAELQRQIDIYKSLNPNQPLPVSPLSAASLQPPSSPSVNHGQVEGEANTGSD